MRRILFPILIAALAVAPASASAAEQVLAVEQAPFTADAYGGVIAWSSYDTQTKNYRLRLLRNGQPADPAVRTLRRPFDLDVGPGEDGSPVVVYSRNGDLYRYDVATAAEGRIDSVSSPHWLESQPSIHGAKIAFVRNKPGASKQRPRPLVYVGSTTNTGAKRQPTPPYKRTIGVDGVEQTARGLLVVWRTDVVPTCCSRATLYRVKDNRLQHIFYVGSGGANFGQLLSPSVSGLNVYFGRTNTGSGQGNTFFRYGLGTKKLSSARGTNLANTLTWLGDRFLMSTAIASAETCNGNLNDPPEASQCRLVLTDPVRWAPASAQDVRRTRP
jgi:hypothetical protein